MLGIFARVVSVVGNDITTLGDILAKNNVIFSDAAFFGYLPLTFLFLFYILDVVRAGTGASWDDDDDPYAAMGPIDRGVEGNSSVTDSMLFTNTPPTITCKLVLFLLNKAN